jgi:hypothetical protein
MQYSSQTLQDEVFSQPPNRYANGFIFLTVFGSYGASLSPTPASATISRVSRA